MKRTDGQIIVGAIILILIVAISIPAIINYIQNETGWTLKEQRTTRAFEMAEAATEQGYQQIYLSTSAWHTIISGGALSGYNFDQTYSDPNGTYEIRINTPDGLQVAVVGVAKDSSSHEIRAVRALYSTSTLGNSAVYAIN